MKMWAAAWAATRVTLGLAAGCALLLLAYGGFASVLLAAGLHPWAATFAAVFGSLWLVFFAIKVRS